MNDTTREVAREARSSTVLRLLARGGYAANGLVHVMIGVVAFVIAFGGRGKSDQTGAFTTIATAPLGFAALWVIAALLAGLGLWHVAAGTAVLRSSDAKKWGVRLSEWGQAAVFLALAVIAATVALGSRPDANETVQQASRGVLTVPGGPWLLGLVGIGIGIGGIAFIVMGVRRSYRNKVTIPRGALEVFVTALGSVGFVAKGIALSVLAVLLVIAAVRVDPDTAGGLDSAIRALLEVTGGPAIVAAVGAGFVAYGIFCFFRARYARL
ncbi:DUF1206 domain-containing protein [Microbacterium sp.]|uniref:DUF1206 domain-containing protein n=1 Tax=Microbacterium sp. TaxID=51671 RepID=UPI0039E25DA9